MNSYTIGWPSSNQYYVTSGTSGTTSTTSYSDLLTVGQLQTLQWQQPTYQVQHLGQVAPPKPSKAPSGFNRYVNASDLLEEFIRFLGDEGVRQAEVMGLPVELFVKWLIIKACEHDGEEPNVTLQLPAPKSQPRCLGCQRFLPAGMPIPIHDQRCAGFFFARQEAA